MNYQQRREELLAEIEAIDELLAKQDTPTEADVGRLCEFWDRELYKSISILTSFDADPYALYDTGPTGYEHARIYHGPHPINMKPYTVGDEVPELGEGEIYLLQPDDDCLPVTAVTRDWATGSYITHYAILRIYK